MSVDQSLPYALLAVGKQVLAEPVGPESADALHHFLRHAVFDTYFFQPSREAIVSELAANAARYRDAAEEWLSRFPSSDWKSAIPPQGWVARVDEQPRVEKFESATGYWGNAVWRPPRGGLWTCTVTDGTTPWLDQLAPDVKHLWILEPAVDAGRIFEVNTSDDWLALVEEYPVEVDRAPTIGGSVTDLPAAPLYMPDWKRVAEDWDAVHFTIAGKLRGLYVVSPVGDGFTLVHGEEALEETLWLRWAFAGSHLAA